MFEKQHGFIDQPVMPRRRKVLQAAAGLMAMPLLAGAAMPATAGQTKAGADHHPVSTSGARPDHFKEQAMKEATYVQEYNAIVDVLNKYNEGGAKASSAIMKPAFSEKATMFAIDADNKLAGGPIQGLFDIIDTAFRPSPEAKAAIVRIDIVGSAASARVDTDNLSGYRFTDFFNLLKVDGKWTIVSKIYHTHPGA